MLLVTLIILSVIYVVYILVGAAIFMVMEKKEASPDPVYVTESTIFKQFIENTTNLTVNAATQFAQALINEYDAGLVRVSNVTKDDPFEDWSFDASVFFVMTVITTIGYGNIHPVTTAGKVFFFFYAAHGIPLTAVLLIGLGERIVKPYTKFERHRFTVNYPKCEQYAKRTISLVLTYSLFSLIPALVFVQAEGWSYLDAWYFTMVTLTTVGFGDFIPAHADGPYVSIYRVLCGLWIFFGLAWLSCVFSIISNHMTETSKAIDNKIEEECKHTIKHDDTDEVKQTNKKLEDVDAGFI